MGCIVSKLFLDFYIFFIFTRPLSLNLVTKVFERCENSGQISISSLVNRRILVRSHTMPVTVVHTSVPLAYDASDGGSYIGAARIRCQ